MQPSIVCFEGIDYELQDELPESVEVYVHGGAKVPLEVDLSAVRAVVVRNRTEVGPGFLDRFPRLEFVGRAGTGLDNLDLTELSDRRIEVVSGAGLNATSVAEHTLMLALSAGRSLVALHESTRAGDWDRRPGVELYGKSWGLVGAGATGRETGRLAQVLGMQVCAYDPFVTHKEMKELGFKKVNLLEIPEECLVISCHMPSVKETAGLLDDEFFARVRSESIFVNTGRGEVVDEAALVSAIHDGRLLGAGLDVREQEPPAVGVMESLENVILTPHVAGITRDSQNRIRNLLVERIVEHFRLELL